jgi:peptidoglycan/xylan/chitin deacetylase (PgdA/CDA1 family)/uncharacterized caspase-like protein
MRPRAKTIRCCRRFLLIGALSVVLWPVSAAADGDVLELAHAAVDDYRRIVVLMSEPPADADAERERMIGRVLFFRNQARGESLSARMAGEPAAASRFLNWLEADVDLRDADKLAFLEVLIELEQQLPENAAGSMPELRARIRNDIAVLRQIQSMYGAEVRTLLARLNTRGMQLKRESWDSYLQFVRSRFQADAILREFAQTPLEEPTARGARKNANNQIEVNGSALPARTLVLTFDDGPHARYTDRILDILQQEGLPAVFFEVGHNIGTVQDDGTVKLTRAAKSTRRILEMGHALGNHSFSHPVLPSLSDDEVAREIERTNRALEAATEQTTVLFRAPYGARNQGILSALQARHLKSIMWNIDSEDWADPIPESIAARVVSEVENQKHGIVLFHDIHERTVEALPLVIKSLKEAGYRFAGWDGAKFQVAAAPAVRGAPAAKQARVSSPYRDSWAVVIGIDDYAKWPRLRYAVHDAQSIRDVLIERYQFKPENVFLLRDREATRENILSLLGDKLANPDLVKHDDRVFVFFAGHGATRRLPSGRELGYIIPAEADLQNFQGQAISMTNFQDISEAIPAKHVLFVMDSCYSGLALTRGVAPSIGQNFLEEISRRPVRQMLTAGGGDQQVADGGPNGHSVFTWTLMQALEGNGDLNGDGVITGAELAAYVGPIVSSLAAQTPAFGSMPGSQGGEFVFELKPESEFLNSQSQELDEEAVQLNAEIARLRVAITEKAERNRKLKEELSAAQKKFGENVSPIDTRGVSPRESASIHNDRGTALFREKKYAQAAQEFQAAVELDPESALAANNLGFAQYKLGAHLLAVEWFQKAVRLDPKRAIAYYNLGDAYFELSRTEEARQAYESFLALQPNAKAAPQVREKLRGLAAQ